MMKYSILVFLTLILFIRCSKDDKPLPSTGGNFVVKQVQIDEKTTNNALKGVSLKPKIVLNFDVSLNQNTALQAIELLQNGTKTELQLEMSSDKKTITLSPKNNLSPLTSYTFVVRNTLTDENGERLNAEFSTLFSTQIDNSDKFPRISTEELLTKVQKQTFAYFWDFAHPAYGMIRERNSSGDVVTSGGTGFGIMALVVGVERGFITKAQGLQRVKNIVQFLKMADKYHGAFSHWYNGNSGKTVPFGTKDNGADLVETALLFQGLLTARNYFNDSALHTDITKLYHDVEWNFFRNNQQGLFWHWSPNHAWDMNLKISGWNESLIVYVLAAGSSNYAIDLVDYENGWAKNGAMKNGNSYYNITLPLGPERGGPLFLSQYSFLGINPNALTDTYANYETQVKNHTLINRAYCIANPQNYYGYGPESWGLTASDNMQGYSAHSPSNDLGVITPSAALTSMAYTPQESLAALEFFYYKLGDKLWGTYGFKDAYSLDKAWFADSYIAIDQGPIIIGIENHRSGLLWKHFMQSPEIKNGLTKLKFNSPNI